MYTKTRSQEGTAVHFRQTVKSKRATGANGQPRQVRAGQVFGAKDYPEVRSFSLKNEDAQ